MSRIIGPNCWNVPRGVDRSRYYMKVKQVVSQAVRLSSARNRHAIVDTMILASLTNSYVEGSSQLLDVCGQSVRNHLKEQDPLEFIRINDQDVVARLRSMGAFSRPLTLGIDTHDIMYYGDPRADGIAGTQPKKGSHWAYKFASIAVLLNGERVTLAALPVLHEARVEHVRGLIERATALGVKPRLVLLDGAYNAAEVINYLNSIGVRYVIRIAPPIEVIKAGDDFSYTTRGHRRKKDDQATFRVVAIKGRDKSGKIRLFVFATNTAFRPKRIRKLYKKRWGIETSYRMINKFLARTTSKVYLVRQLYFYLAILLYNLWVVMNYGKREEERIIADALKLHVVLALVLSFISDIDAG